MSESDLVARTRQLLDIQPLIDSYIAVGDALPVEQRLDQRQTDTARAVLSLVSRLREFAYALPALLADNERLNAQVDAGRKINDQLMQQSASDSRMILRLQSEVRALTTTVDETFREAETERETQKIRADAAEARLTQLTERLQALHRPIHDHVADELGLSPYPMSSEPRVEVDRYVVYPSGYDDLVHSDKDSWCLTVTNGHVWGWSVRRGRGLDSSSAMNRKGEFIYESRGSGSNKPRRYPLDEALKLAVRFVDTIRLNGHTAAEASASVAAKLAISEANRG